jgi:hypothetical protein
MARNPTASNSSMIGGGALRAVTPHASAALPDGNCRALYVGGAGDVAVVAVEDTAPVILKNVPAGALLPIRAKAVRVTGTTATDIVAIY